MKRLYEEIINCELDAFIVIDQQNEVKEWNHRAESLYGLTREEAIGKKLSDLIIPPGHRERHEAGVMASPIIAKRMEISSISKSGETIPIELSVVPVHIDGNTYFGASIRDLRQIKKEQVDLRRRASLLNLSRDGIYILNKEHKIVLWNKGAEMLYGYSESEALGNTSYNLLQSKYENGEKGFIDVVGQLMTSGIWEGEIHQSTKDGNELIVLSRWSIDNKNEEILITNTNITELKKNSMRVEYLATHDELTGLPNRRLFDDRIDHAILQSKRHNTKFGIMLLDLDRFKFINDSLGHHKGDLLLKEMGDRLCNSVREEDTVARLGGDEFVILLENIQNAGCLSDIAKKIIDEISKSFILDGHVIRVNASIGLSIFPTDGGDNHTLTRHADLAMYKAKAVDKGSFRFFSSEMNEQVQVRLKNESSLRTALENNEFQLHYQPKICSTENPNEYRFTGVEALIRWNHPTRGMISPIEFIPLAEEIGLIGRIGEWALHEACVQNKAWQDVGRPPIQISVNLSIHQLTDGIVDIITKALRDTHLDAKWLDLEITESAAMNNVDSTISMLHQIRNLGVSLSIDDFGTGFSSLSHLKKMPINTLKIDQSFVQGIPKDHDDICIVRSIIVMAHSMGLKVIAEGVTNREQVAFLDTMQCDEMQGFLFSKPVIGTSITESLTHHWKFPYTNPNPAEMRIARKLASRRC
jgi:diguanylate cyclase (GGDEF)-like protein/PAS domain S-box-containing protein